MWEALIYQIKFWTIEIALGVVIFGHGFLFASLTTKGQELAQIIRVPTSEEKMRADFLTVMSDISAMIPPIENTDQSLIPMKDFMKLKGKTTERNAMKKL